MKRQLSELRLLFLVMLSASSLSTHLCAQCIVVANASQNITLQCANGTFNRSSLAYNPQKQIYYSVNAGSTNYPMETFSRTGDALASVAPNFDYRGLWWNPATSQLEGNDVNGKSISYQNLNATTGYPTGAVTSIFTPGAQPDVQSVGKYDFTNNEIIYYSNGAIYRYNRSTNALAGTVTITGLPVATSSLNFNSVCYTGCTGLEYAVYDYVNRRVYFIRRSNGAYMSTSQLPATAPDRSGFGMSWERGLFWLFHPTDYKWYSYNVFTFTLPLTLTSFTAQAQKGTTLLKWTTANEVNTSRFLVERSTDAIAFSEVAAVKATGNGNNSYQSSDANVPAGSSRLYYRLQMQDKDGIATYSSVVMVNVNGKGPDFVLKPNISSGSTTLVFDNLIPQGATVAVYNLAGIRVMTQKAGSAVNTLQLSTQTLPGGMYIIEVSSLAGTCRQKLMVNR